MNIEKKVKNTKTNTNTVKQTTIRTHSKKKVPVSFPWITGYAEKVEDILYILIIC